MKLFVVGESTADPENWSQWNTPTFVIAETPERAVELAEHFEGMRSDVCELPMTSEMVIWCISQGV